MLVFGALVLVVGDDSQRIIGVGALFIALINAALAIGQWPELKAAEKRPGHERPS
jgi:hypothetical protein